jgi:MFS family permease
MIIVLIQAAKVMPLPFYALYVTEILHATPIWIGASYAVSAATLAISAPLWARLFDHWHPPKILRVIEWVVWGCAVTIAVGALSDNWATFLLSRMLWGIWQGALLPVAYALIANTLPLPKHGLALGLGNSAAKVGALCGVFIGGIGMTLISLTYSFWLVAATYVIAALSIRAIRLMQS